MTTDRYRPRYHFTAPRGWLNDPNGLIQHDGVYHLFYQHNPFGSLWGNMHWGHAASADLVRWRHEPLALAPGPGPEDAGGVFSGCCVIADDGVPTAIYTGVSAPDYRTQLVCVATANGDLSKWTKSPRNPVVAAVPRDDLIGFRDHAVWREGDIWHMLVGSGVKGVGGCVLHYVSPDLTDWRYAGVALQGSLDEGAMWECPDFFALPNPATRAIERVLLISPIPHRQCAYYVGAWDGSEFHPRARATLNFGDAMWAPQSFTDARGRRIMFGWLTEQRPTAEQQASDWNGCMSLPQVLTLDGDGHLRCAPAPEVESLRASSEHFAESVVQAGPPRALDTHSVSIEVEAELDPLGCKQCGLSVLRSPDGEEHTDIVLDVAHQSVWLDASAARRGAHRPRSMGAPLPLTRGEKLRLRAFVDASVVEVFVNERHAFSERVYPQREDSLGAALFSVGGPALGLASVWHMGDAHTV